MQINCLSMSDVRVPCFTMLTHSMVMNLNEMGIEYKETATKETEVNFTIGCIFAHIFEDARQLPNIPQFEQECSVCAKIENHIQFFTKIHINMQIKCRIFVNVSKHLVFLWIFSVVASSFGKN